MFKKGRRVPRRIGTDEDEDAEAKAPAVVVQRPAAKTKKSSAQRTSFAPGVEDLGDGEVVIASKKSNIHRHALERQAELKALPADRLAGEHDRPTYSANYLAELKNSTPSTPRNLTKNDTNGHEAGGLDIVAKFGAGALTAAPPEPSLIPTDAEIREKKERRRRLAKEQDYISLDKAGDGGSASDSEEEDPRSHSLIHPAEELKPKEKYAETRLVHEDEDIAEGFEEFTEDTGQVTLGKRAAREQEKQKRREMQQLIQEAERGGSASESADSEEEARNKAYEAAQTRAGTYGARSEQERSHADSLRRRLDNPPKITPLPELGHVMDQFKQHVRAMEAAQEARRKKLAEIAAQREDLVSEQQRLPKLMQEAAERYEKLRAEIGFDVSAIEPSPSVPMENQHGLESFGAMAALPDG